MPSVCRATCCRTRQVLVEGEKWRVKERGKDPLLTAERVQNTLKKLSNQDCLSAGFEGQIYSETALHKCAFADMDVNSEVKASIHNNQFSFSQAYVIHVFSPSQSLLWLFNIPSALCVYAFFFRCFRGFFPAELTFADHMTAVNPMQYIINLCEHVSSS